MFSQLHDSTSDGSTPSDHAVAWREKQTAVCNWKNANGEDDLSLRIDAAEGPRLAVIRAAGRARDFDDVLALAEVLYSTIDPGKQLLSEEAGRDLDATVSAARDMDCRDRATAALLLAIRTLAERSPSLPQITTTTARALQPLQSRRVPDVDDVVREILALIHSQPRSPTEPEISRILANARRGQSITSLRERMVELRRAHFAAEESVTLANQRAEEAQSVEAKQAAHAAKCRLNATSDALFAEQFRAKRALCLFEPCDGGEALTLLIVGATLLEVWSIDADPSDDDRAIGLEMLKKATRGVSKAIGVTPSDLGLDDFVHGHTSTNDRIAESLALAAAVRKEDWESVRAIARV